MDGANDSPRDPRVKAELVVGYAGGTAERSREQFGRGRANPDVAVDPKTGWTIAELETGKLGECLDNLQFYVDP